MVRVEVNRKPGGFTLVELLVSIAIISLLAALLLPVLSRTSEGARRASCAGNMRELSTSLQMYANDQDEGRWVPKSPIDHNLMFDFNFMFSDYLESLEVFFCPSDMEDTALKFLRTKGQGWRNTDDSLNPEIINGTWIPGDPRPSNWPTWPQADPTLPLEDQNAPPSDVSYVYMGWAFTNAEYMEPLGAFLLAYQQAIADGKVDRDLKFTHPGNALVKPGTEVTLFRLRDGISRFRITDYNNTSAAVKAQSEIAVLWDNFGGTQNVFNHMPLGSNVVFMDGHAEVVLFEPTSLRLPVAAVMSDFMKAARTP